MVRSLFAQFQGEQSEMHPGPLMWPGDADGFPILGNGMPGSPLLKNEELEELNRISVFRNRMFQLWVEEDNQEYQVVMERIGNGWFLSKFHERIFQPSISTTWPTSSGTRSTLKFLII
jgi:hypothetical protein